MAIVKLSLSINGNSQTKHLCQMSNSEQDTWWDEYHVDSKESVR